MQEVFANYANGPEMDGKTFAKLFKDCRLVTKECKNTDYDLIFAKCKERTARKLNYQQFLNACGESAKKHGMTKEAFEAKILERSSGPVLTGTQAEAVRFHDDKD